MKVTKKVKQILDNYDSCNVGVKTNIARILMSGALGGSGKMVILPVDQGFEHGPERSFSKNPDAYDPDYHFQLAIDAKLNAYAAPLGAVEASADKFAGSIPLILKVNSSNSLTSKQSSPTQAITASVKDALRLGCSAIGMTIYPGTNGFNDSVTDLKEMIYKAKKYGLATVIWSYARGEGVSKDGETAIDVISYSAHIAALLGADIIKVKPPVDFIEQSEAKKAMEGMKTSTLKDRIAIVKRSCFNGKRLVVFSGGAAKNDDEILKEISEISQGGGDGSIIGRNAFQRKNEDAKDLLQKIIQIYKK
ncbi:class I fructose-bisphosphate aldolase [Candidatus Deianiraea vastatrix]|nr:class I fructose-bisphosphate aldolase [Candidatus Deianiraea vastatrix]